MNFDDILREARPDTQQEVVGLAIYFLERVRGIDPVTKEDIQRVIKQSRESVPSSNIGTYISRLDSEGTIARHEGDDYRVSIDGIEKYSEETGIPEAQEEIRQERFIEYEDADGEFYQNLIDDINQSYQVGIDDATLILSRKLLENLVLDLLRLRYGLDDERRELFYNTEKGRLLGFSRLLDNLGSNLDDFVYYSDRMDEDLIRQIEDLKGRGDASAHSVETNVSDETISEHKADVNPVVDVLFYVKQEIRDSE
jgi:hypothetical protein